MKGLDAQQSYIPDLARPLFDNTDIDFFEYQKMNPDSSGLYLSSQPLLSDICIEQNIQSTYNRLKTVYEQKKAINSLHNIFYFLPKEDNQPVNSVVKDFGYSTIFCIMEYFDDYVQSFVFASDRTEDLIRFCFTNFDVLIQFKNHFMRQSRKLIHEAEKHQIQLCEDDTNNNNNLIRESNMAFNKEHFMEETKPSHYYVNFKGSEVEITAREFDTLKCLAQGRTNKEAANILGISANTIENYQELLKNKFDLSNRNALIDIYLKSDLVVL